MTIRPIKSLFHHLLIAASCSLAVSLFFSCAKADSKSNAPDQPIVTEKPTEKSIEKAATPAKDKELDPGINNVFSAPVISLQTSPKEVEQLFKAKIKQADQALAGLEKMKKKMTIRETANTPVTIWLKDSKPVKIEYGVANDNGKFDSKFTYYLLDNKVWFAEDDTYKFTYQNDLIRFRLDKNWKTGRVVVKQFSQQKKEIKATIEKILASL